jgi:hypothetical protein
MAKKSNLDNLILGSNPVNPISGLTEKPKSASDLFSDNFQMIPQTPPEIGMYGNTGVGESKFDENIMSSEIPQLEQIRALNQSGTGKAFNAVVGGVASGLLTAAETTGYILDFNNNINRILGLEEVDGNILTELAKKGKEGLEKVMPIYRQDAGETFDWDDPGFYWSTVKGILDSAVGFAIPGMGATKAVGLAQKAIRTSKYLEFLKGSQKVQQMVNAGLSGYITNFGEGKMMAIEQFENVVNELTADLMRKNYDDLIKRNPDLPQGELYTMAQEISKEQLAKGELKKFNTIAGEQANKFMLKNKIFALTDAIGLHNIYKGQGFTRALIKEQSLKSTTKRLGQFTSDNLLLQAGKEGLEEIGQNVLQMEGQYQAEKKANKDVSDRPEDLMSRVIEFATSDQALLEGMMGLFGGGPQRILTEGVSGNLGKKSKQAIKDRWQEQQLQIKTNKEFLETKLNNYSKAQQLRAEALTKNEDNADEIIKNSQFVTLVTENFIKGTTEQLERNLQDIANGVSEEQRLANGWDENYQQQAQEQLEVLKAMEKRYSRYTRYENQANVFKNRENRIILEEARRKVKELVEETQNELELQEVQDPAIKDQLKSYEIMLQQLTDEIVATDNRFKELTSAKTQQDIRDQKKKFREEAKKLVEKKKADTRVANQKESKKAADKKIETKKKAAEKAKVKTEEEEAAKPEPDIDVTTLIDEEERDITPDVNEIDLDQIDPVMGEINPAEIDRMAAVQQAEKEGKVLSQEIVSNLGIAEDLVSDEQAIPLLEELIKRIKITNETDNVTFDDIIEKIIANQGSITDEVFSRLERVYSNIDPSYEFKGSLEEYTKLTETEQREDEANKKTSKVITKDQYGPDTEEETKDEQDDIDVKVRKRNIAYDPNESPIVVDYLLSESGSGILAYLSRQYDRVFRGRTLKIEETTNGINQEMVDKSILDPSKLKPGTKVTLKLEEDRDTKVYIEGDYEKRRTTWGAKTDKWAADEAISTDDFNRLVLEQVPIAVYVDGQKIGYLHETEWINETNIVPENVEADKERSRKIRRFILDNKEYTTTINKKTIGHLMRVAGEPISTADALDESIPIVVAAQGELTSTRNEPFTLEETDELLNTNEFREGVTYAVLPIGENGKVAVPLFNNKLEENEAIVDSIMRAFEIFLSEDTSEEATRIVDAIYENTGLNITTNTGFRDYVEMFVNNYNIGENQSFKQFLLDSTTPDDSERIFMNMYKIAGDDLQLEISGGAGAGFQGMSKSLYKKSGKGTHERILGKIRELLMKSYMNVNLDKLNTDSQVAIINEEGVFVPMTYNQYVRENTKSAFFGDNIAAEGEQPNYIYAIQPTIEMDFSEIVGDKTVTPKETAKKLGITYDGRFEQNGKVLENFIVVVDNKPYNFSAPLGTPFDEILKRKNAIIEAHKQGKAKSKPDEKTDDDKENPYDEDYEEGINISDSPISDDSLADSSDSARSITEEERAEMREKTEVVVENGKVISGILINDLGAISQHELMDFLRSQIVDQLFVEKKVSREGVYDKWKGIFERTRDKDEKNLRKAVDLADAEAMNRFAHRVRILNDILSNWDKVTALTTEQMLRIDSVKLYQNEDGSFEEITEEEGKEGERWHDSSAFITDPAGKLAPEIKQFLSGIPMYEIRDTVEGGREFVRAKNFFGLDKTMNFQDVYNILQRITPGLRPSYEDVMQAINKHAETFPFLKDVADRLDKASDQIKAQFVSGMTNHYVDMRFILFSRNENGSYRLEQMNSNSNAITQVIKDQWFVNFINSDTVIPYIRSSEEGNDYILNKDIIERLDAKRKQWIEKDEYPAEELREWLEAFGITLHDKTFEILMSGSYTNRGKKHSVKNLVKYNLFKYLIDDAKKKGDNSVVTGKKVIDQTAISDLARFDARHNIYAYSNSHRTGNKTVYSYSQNKFLVNRLRELKEFNQEGNNGLLDRLSKLSFNGQSAWITALRENGGDNSFHENFHYWIAALEPLKKRGAKSRDDNELDKLSTAEIEVFKIGMLQAIYSDLSNKGERVIQLLYPTSSDKTTVMGLRVLAQDLALDREGNIKDESIETLVKLLVEPELQRIISYQEKKAKGQHPDIKEYRQGAEQFLFLPELNKIPNMFNEDGRINPNARIELDSEIKATVRNYIEYLVQEKLDTWNKSEIGKNGSQFLNNDFMNGSVGGKHNPVAQVNKESKVKAAATDMVFQYLIANAEIAKTFTGDPALYYKQHSSNRTVSRNDEKYDYSLDSEETYINIGKRLAADIAPGYEIMEDKGKKTYRQALVQDAPSSSLVKKQITKLLDGQEAYNKIKDLEGDELIAAVKGLESEAYYSFEGTDAQEYTTWKEHLRVMKQAGDISDADYKSIYEELSKKNPKLNKKQINIILQPMKPVYVDNQIDEIGDVERRIYIKSSSFPLIPGITAGTELDKLRVAMENEKTGVDRLSYSTAVKIGNVSNPISIFDDKGNIKNNIDFTNSRLTLNRKGFRIQQKVPLKDKQEINKVTQASKNLLVNMLGVEGFEVPWLKGPVNGKELQREYHKLYERLHKIAREDLLNEITVDGTEETIDIAKLRQVLLKEAKERNYPISDQELLSLDKDLRILPFSPSVTKYEALLNSLVTNRVIKLKLPGKSYILGSEEGFKGLIRDEQEAQEIIDSTEGIVFTSKYDPKTGLKPSRIVNGKRLPSQAIVPWKITNQDGKVIDIRDYVKEETKDEVTRIVLDEDKMDSDVLSLFGMRIPNQGPNSQSAIEIVGFLPKNAGDLIIATRDFVPQMGSDFDVDKLYTYQYNTYVDRTGHIKVNRSTATRRHEEKTLQNRIIDVHLAIHQNNDERVQSQISRPLDLSMKQLKKVANDVADSRRDRQSTGKMFTGLSDEYQRNKFKNATAGKAGVGVFSLDSMFNAVAQGKNLVLIRYDEEGKKIPIQLTLGKYTSKGELSREFTLDDKTFISDVIAGYQSAAVDNEKEQILDKLNINSHTFKVIKALNQLGFTEEAPLFVAQDIIIDYVEALEKLSSSLTGYVPGAKQQAMRMVLDMPKYKTNLSADPSLAAEKATPENLRKYIKLGEQAPNYVLAQRAILEKFMEIDGYGQTIQTLQSAINPDSKGVGKSYIHSKKKQDQVIGLLTSRVTNAASLVGDMYLIEEKDRENFKNEGYTIIEHNSGIYAIRPTTINGHAIAYGLVTNNKLWKNLFPYETPAVAAVFDKVEQIAAGSNESNVNVQADRNIEVWKGMKSYILSDSNLELYTDTITEERNRLLYDRYEQQTVQEDNMTIQRSVQVKQSLASFLKSIENTKRVVNNAFLSKLSYKLHKNGSPSTIVYNASASEGLDELSITTGFMQMIEDIDPVTGESPVIGKFNGEDYTLKELVEDLVLYSYITGGIQEAVQFTKYIPAAYIASIPLYEQLRYMSYELSDFGINPPSENPIDDLYDIPDVVEQFIQHNPTRVSQVTEDVIITDVKKLDKVTSFKIQPDYLDVIGISVGDEVRHAPPYVTMRVGYSSSGLKLFKYDTTDGTYKQIDTLGSLGNSEYNRNTYHQTSLIRNNKSPLPLEKRPLNRRKKLTIIEDNAPEKQESKEQFISQIRNGLKKNTIYENGKEKVKEVLNEMMIEGTNPYHAVLAEQFFNNIDKLPDALVFEVTDEIPITSAGRYTYVGKKAHTLSLQRTNLTDDPKKERRITNDYIGETLLHELIHGFTGYKIQMYLDEQSQNATDIARLERYKTEMPDLQLTEEERRIIKSIKVLFNYVNSQVSKNESLSKEYNEFKRKFSSQEDVSTSEIGRFYGLTDLREFITTALTKPKFQEFLNNIESPNKKKTVFQSLIDKLISLLRSTLGIEIKENSVLEAVLSDVMELVNLNDNKVATEGVQDEITARLEDVIKDTARKYLPKEKVKSKIATQYIGDGGGNDSSTERYKKLYEEYGLANTGNYSYDDIVWVSSNGKRGNRFNPIVNGELQGVYKNIDLAIKAGATIVMDTADHIERTKGYNIGEVALAEYMDSKNYQREGSTGIWKPNVAPTTIETFVQFGTTYKFTINDKGVVLKADYSQGSTNEWKPLTSKKVLSKYEELKKGKEEVKKLAPDAIKDENTMVLPDGRTIIFSEEQLGALKGIREWLNNKDPFYTLSGYAGTGKTTIVKKILDETKRSIVVSAPTHKAKKKVEETTRQGGATLHALLGLRPNIDLDNFNPNSPEFAPIKPAIINKYGLVIIDEASMINEALYKLINETIKGGDTKVLYMGDEAQIPPVGEAKSIVFTANENEMYQLVETQRLTNGNPLGKIYDNIRNNLTKADTGFEKKTEVNERGEGIIFTSDEDLFIGKVLEAFLSNEYEESIEHAKIIAWRNFTVSSLNKTIRNAKFGENANIIENGDTLMGYRGISDDYGGNLIENSAEYKVSKRSDKQESYQGLSGWTVRLIEKVGTREESRNVFIVDTNIKENVDRYVELHDRYVREAKGNKKLWARYYDFRRNNLIMENIKGSSGTIAKDLDYGYAITAHKSQGSTYKHVFVLENDIDMNRKIKERNQIKYVSLSRPTHTATVLSRNVVAEKNTKVDSPVKEPVDIDVMPSEVSERAKDDIDVNSFPPDFGDIPPPTIDGSFFSQEIFSKPQEFVTDKELDEFIKQCKGL